MFGRKDTHTAVGEASTTALPPPKDTIKDIIPAVAVHNPKTIIWSDTTMQGDMTGSHFKIHGTVDGNIGDSKNPCNEVEISDGAVVRGDIYTHSLIVAGKIHGNFTAEQACLKASAHVDGQLNYVQLDMQAGAKLKGTLNTLDAFPVSATTTIRDVTPAE